MLTFRLPRPPSSNNLYRNNRGDSRGGRTLTKAHAKWRAEAMKLVMVQRHGASITGPYKLQIIVERKPGSDLGNLEKAVSDCLVQMSIVTDDQFAERIVLQWGDIIGCEVTVEPCSASR